MQADLPEILGLNGINFSLSRSENDVVLELSADIGNLDRLRKIRDVCVKYFPELLNDAQLDMQLENLDPDLVLELPGQADVKAKEHYLLKLLIVGEFSSGKTSLIHRYVENTYARTTPTIGVDFKCKEINLGDHPCRLQLWDAAGAARFRDSIRIFFRASAGILLTVDLTRDLSEVMKGFREILRNAYVSDYMMLLVGTKCDSVHRKLDRKTVEQFAEKIGVPYLECSARNDINISAVFDIMSKMVLRQIPPRYVFKLYIKNINPALFSNPQLYHQLNRLVQSDLIPYGQLNMQDVGLSLYKKAVAFLEDAEGKQCLAVTKLHVKNLHSENGFIRREAKLALENTACLDDVLHYFMQELESDNGSNRTEAIDGLRQLNKLNTPEVVRRCENLLGNIALNVKERAREIFETIETLSCAEIVDACFESTFVESTFFDNKSRINTGICCDAFRVLKEINAHSALNFVKNRIFAFLLVEAKSHKNIRAIRIVMEKYKDFLHENVPESSFRSSFSFSRK